MSNKILKILYISIVLYNCTKSNYIYRVKSNSLTSQNIKYQNILNKEEELGNLNSIEKEEESLCYCDCLCEDLQFKYFLNNNNEIQEYEIELNKLNERMKKYFFKKHRHKIRISNKIKKNFGEDKIRVHWDLNFKPKYDQIENEDFNSKTNDSKVESIIIEQGNLKIEDWLKIKDQSIIQNLDPLYLDKCDSYPKEYVRLLQYNKCKRNGLLLLSRIIGGLLLVSMLSLETFFIYKSFNDINYFCAAFIFGLYGSLFLGLLVYFLCDPFFMFFRKNWFYKFYDKEYKLSLKEPNKIRKTLCCMRESSIKGFYKCCCCFNYPDCLYFCIMDIFSSIRCFMKSLNCCKKKKLPSIELELSKHKDLNSNENTIELAVGEEMTK